MRLLAKNVLFTFLIPGTVAVYAPWFLLPHAPVMSWLGTWPGVLLLTLGGCIYSWCLWDFASFGRGTPAPIDPPTRLVARGLYRYSRNPMYLGVLSVLLGWSLLLRSPAHALYALAVGTCFHLFVVLYEEPYLARTFGASYDQYRAEVGRWISLGKRREARPVAHVDRITGPDEAERGLRRLSE